MVLRRPGIRMSPGRSRLARVSLVFALLAAGLSAGEPPRRIAEGAWGGDHVAMSVVADSANLDLDCASGRIDGPLVVDSEGRFDLRGFFKREHPGPIRRGEESAAGDPARFTGKTDGRELHFTITLVGSGETVGTYKATLGARGRVHKCL
jgi:hypothetical protein